MVNMSIGIFVDKKHRPTMKEVSNPERFHFLRKELWMGSAFSCRRQGAALDVSWKGELRCADRSQPN